MTHQTDVGRLSGCGYLYYPSAAVFISRCGPRQWGFTPLSKRTTARKALTSRSFHPLNFLRQNPPKFEIASEIPTLWQVEWTIKT